MLSGGKAGGLTMNKALLVRTITRLGAGIGVFLGAAAQVACTGEVNRAGEVGEASAGISGCGEWSLPVASVRAEGCGVFGAGDTPPHGRSAPEGSCVAPGTEVVAVADGVVSYASWYKPCETWAYLLLIEHALVDGARVCSLYRHVKPLDTIVVGASVAGGDPVGNVHRAAGAGEDVRFGIYKGACPAWAPTTCPANGILPDSSFPGVSVDPLAFLTEECPALG